MPGSGSPNDPSPDRPLVQIEQIGPVPPETDRALTTLLAKILLAAYRKRHQAKAGVLP